MPEFYVLVCGRPVKGRLLQLGLHCMGPMSTDSLMGLVPDLTLVTAMTCIAVIMAFVAACVIVWVMSCALAIFCIHFCQLLNAYLCIFLSFG